MWYKQTDTLMIELNSELIPGLTHQTKCQIWIMNDLKCKIEKKVKFWAFMHRSLNIDKGKICLMSDPWKYLKELEASIKENFSNYNHYENCLNEWEGWRSLFFV